MISHMNAVLAFWVVSAVSFVESIEFLWYWAPVSVVGSVLRLNRVS